MFDRNFLIYGTFELFSAEFKSDFKVTKWTFFEIILIYGIFPSFFSCFTFIIIGEKKSDLANYKGDYEKKNFHFIEGRLYFFRKNHDCGDFGRFRSVQKCNSSGETVKMVFRSDKG